jgi:ABC-type ATPase involved in cell division
MPRADIVKQTPIKRTPRVMQLESLFELAPTQTSENTWQVHLPIEQQSWNIGLIVGPSGSGKSTIINHIWPDQTVAALNWPSDQSIVDAFPKHKTIKEITAALSSVGFSSPPAWLRPYSQLSNGEQFRATLARAIIEANPQIPFVIDEYTSVVDRTVAQIGSAAVAKTIRKNNLQMIAAGVHYDVINWLQPDWIYDTAEHTFAWRSVQPRPAITLQITRTNTNAWRRFKHHHYLDTNLHKAAACFVASIDNKPTAFTAVLSFPHATHSGWREHRTVCLPDYQGVGIGNALSEFVASLYAATGKAYYSTTSSPAMIWHRAKSTKWNMLRKPSRTGKQGKTSQLSNMKTAHNRITAGFRYAGAPNPTEAKRLKVIK